jgi:hypothetical protein
MKSLTKMLVATTALALAAPMAQAQTILTNNSGWTEFSWNIYSSQYSIGSYQLDVTGKPQLFEIADGYNAGDEFEFSVGTSLGAVYGPIQTSTSYYNPSVYSPLYYIGDNYSAAFWPDEAPYFSHYALFLDPGQYTVTGNVDQFTESADYIFYGIGTAAVQLIDVPEPATWTLAIIGFGAIGGTLRARRSRRLAKA